MKNMKTLKSQGRIVWRTLDVSHERGAVGRQNVRGRGRECKIVSPMSEGACVRYGTHG